MKYFSQLMLFLTATLIAYSAQADGFNINAEVQRIAHILNQIDGQVARNGAIAPATYSAAVDRLEKLADSKKVEKLERAVLQAARAVLNAPPGTSKPSAERVLARYGGALFHISELRNELARALTSTAGQRGLARDRAQSPRGTVTVDTGLRESRYKEPVRKLLQASYNPRAGNFSAGLDLLKSRMNGVGHGTSPVDKWRQDYKALNAGGYRTGTAKDGTRHRAFPGTGLLDSSGGGRYQSGF